MLTICIGTAFLLGLALGGVGVFAAIIVTATENRRALDEALSQDH